MSKVFILHLMFDCSSQPGAMSYEIKGVSLDRTKIEELKVFEQEKLDEEFGIEREEGEDEEDDFGDEGDWDDYMGYSLSGRPYLRIEEKDLI